MTCQAGARNPVEREGFFRGQWNDFNFGGSSLGQLGAANPDAITLFGSGGIKGYAFNGNATTEELHGSGELLHGYEEGQNLYVHAHWMPVDTDAGNVLWQFEYSIANVGEVFPAPTILSTPDAASGVVWTHQIIGLGIIAGLGLKINAQIMFRFFRDPTEGLDTYGSDAALIGVGIHTKFNSGGSRQEYIK